MVGFIGNVYFMSKILRWLLDWSLFYFAILSDLCVFNYLAGEERADCYTLIVFLLSCDCVCSMSAVCDCGNSW